MYGVQAKKVAKYILLPGIIPRARNLFASGFGYVAYLMASIYGMVRLLPPGHPYLDPRNTGKFGIRHVIGEAANNLVVSRKNIDQLVIFVALLAGIIILLLQLALLIYAYAIKPALAQSLFATAAPDRDIALMLLDYVFGVPNFFGSCVATGTICPGDTVSYAFPSPFHIALHGMFQFYSIGLLLVGVVIFLYFVVVVIAETATSGSPFGQRFSNIWVPIRLVVALGLLVPLNYGLNTGQYITLFAAKAGSAFATNAWNQFNNTIKDNAVFSGNTENPSGERDSLVALPNPPDIASTVQFMSIVHSCAYGHWRHNSGRSPSDPRPPSATTKIKPYFVKQPFPWMANSQDRVEITPSTTYINGLDFYNNSDILIRFGEFIDDYDVIHKGNVEPTCGEIRIVIGDLSHRGTGKSGTVGGADQMQEFYFDIIKQMWFGSAAQNGNNELIELAQRYTELSLNKEDGADLKCTIGASNPRLPQPPEDCKNRQPDASAKQALINDYQAKLNAEIQVAWDKYNRSGADIQITQDVLDRGWAGAGIWYNNISKINGGFIGSVINTPIPVSYPKVMQDIRAAKRTNDADFSYLNQFCPTEGGDKVIEVQPKAIGKALCDFHVYWNTDGANQAKQDKRMISNPLEDLMNILFGTNGLMAMRGRNAHLHPMAQLAAVGKGLVNSAVINVAAATGLAALGGPFAAIAPLFGAAADAFSDIAITTAFVGLTAGFVLFYVLPFLPFLYFFFAIGSWIKTIFEAMVGAPLWALAHLRVDGEGLPGDAASNGYFLIFEIFIRPILVVFGLLASTIIFTAQVRVLNFIWDVVVSNVTGYNPNPVITMPFQISVPHNAIDQFFYTIVYTIIVYMLATASFKLIDKVPDNMLRWMGAGVSSFGDINQDPTDSLTKYAAIGGLTMGQQATKGLQEFAKGTGGAIGGELAKLRNVLGGGK